MSVDDYCYSKPVPDHVKDDYIPTELYRQAVQLCHETFPNNSTNHFAAEHLQTPTACPSHIRNLQELARAPTRNFPTDCMIPGFVKQHWNDGYDMGRYHIGRVQIKIKTTTSTSTTTTTTTTTTNDKWIDVALIVNEGDADCNTGFWGGAFRIIMKEETSNGGRCSLMTLTPMAWIRSVGDTETVVEEAKNLPRELVEVDGADLEFDRSVLLHGNDEQDDDEEDDASQRDLFGQGLTPGLCKTPLEKLVGAACCQMMRHENRNFVNIPPLKKGTRDDNDRDNDEDEER